MKKFLVILLVLMTCFVANVNAQEWTFLYKTKFVSSSELTLYKKNDEYAVQYKGPRGTCKHGLTFEGINLINDEIHIVLGNKVNFCEKVKLIINKDGLGGRQELNINGQWVYDNVKDNLKFIRGSSLSELLLNLRENNKNLIAQVQNQELSNTKIIDDKINPLITIPVNIAQAQAQAEPEKAKTTETHGSVDQKIVDLSFDLGDGRKIQLPNGKWRVFEEYKFGSTQDYKAIIFKNELVEKSPVYFSIYFSNKKEIKWNGGCGQLEKLKKLYFSGMQSNGIDKNTISCGSYNYYDRTDAASIDHVITRDDYLAKVLKTISEDQSIIIQSFIIERGGDNKMVMAMIEPINSKNIQTKNSDEYIKISKWNELFLKIAEESFYENRQVASLDLVSRSISAQKTQLASVPTNTNQAVANDDKLKEQQRLALEAQQKDQALMAQESNQKDKYSSVAEQNAKEQLRLSEEAKLKDQQRLAFEAQQKEQLRLAEEAKLKEQQRLAFEAQQKELVLLADAAKAKELVQLTRMKELEAIAEAAKSKDLELAKLKEELARVQEQNAKQKLVTANRRAFVVGNDSYKQVNKLFNSREDARTIADNLSRVGYSVTTKLDMSEREMRTAWRIFKSQIQPGDEVAFFYAGHGVQLGNTNYLLPVDVSNENEDQIKDEGMTLQRILDDLSERKARFSIAMIDACRDNPFVGSGRNIGGTSRGLAPTTAATGQMIIFSAGAGQQALDRLGPQDKNKNGVFTRVFVKEMLKPGISVDRVVRNVRNEVVELARSIGHEQVPAIYDQVVGEFFFTK